MTRLEQPVPSISSTMAGFDFPNFGQLTEAFRKAQQIQQDAQKLQEELVMK